MVSQAYQSRHYTVAGKKGISLRSFGSSGGMVIQTSPGSSIAIVQSALKAEAAAAKQAEAAAKQARSQQER